jgi:hypothetical protein
MDAVPVQDPDTTSVGAYGVSLAKRPGLPSMCPGLPSGAVTQVRRYVANGHHGSAKAAYCGASTYLRTKG